MEDDENTKKKRTKRKTEVQPDEEERKRKKQRTAADEAEDVDEATETKEEESKQEKKQKKQKENKSFASLMHAGLRKFLERSSECQEFFEESFFDECEQIPIQGPGEQKQREVLGKYFPGVALPPATASDALDFRFHRPARPNPLTEKWKQIETFKVGLIVGPSGCGKVCMLCCSFAPGARVWD
jgi:hypothetical protein